MSKTQDDAAKAAADAEAAKAAAAAEAAKAAAEASAQAEATEAEPVELVQVRLTELLELPDENHPGSLIGYHRGTVLEVAADFAAELVAEGRAQPVTA